MTSSRTLISSVCGLLKRNIRAYRELVEMLCLQTTLVYQRELQKQQSRQQTEATEQADKQKSTTDPAEVAYIYASPPGLALVLLRCQRQVLALLIINCRTLGQLVSVVDRDGHRDAAAAG